MTFFDELDVLLAFLQNWQALLNLIAESKSSENWNRILNYWLLQNIYFWSFTVNKIQIFFVEHYRWVLLAFSFKLNFLDKLLILIFMRNHLIFSKVHHWLLMKRILFTNFFLLILFLPFHWLVEAKRAVMLNNDRAKVLFNFLFFLFNFLYIVESQMKVIFQEFVLFLL